MKHCSICGKEVSEDAAILTMGGLGSPRLLCDECEELLDRSLNGKEYGDLAEATDTLAERLEKFGNEDSAVLEKVGELFSQAKERAELIKSGDYDFSAEEAPEEEVEEIPEELRETEEDRLLDEEEAKENKKIDKITTIICGVAFVAVLVFFIVKFIL